MACYQRLSVRKAGRQSGKLVYRPAISSGEGRATCGCEGWFGSRGKDHCGQATKGVWRMSWRQKAMKGVEGCEKPGEAVKQALIPGFPNDRAPNP